MARKWEAPKILAVDGLPKALGDCLGGSTDGATGGELCGCHNGQNTLGLGVRIAGDPGNTSPSMHGSATDTTPLEPPKKMLFFTTTVEASDSLIAAYTLFMKILL